MGHGRTRGPLVNGHMQTPRSNSRPRVPASSRGRFTCDVRSADRVSASDGGRPRMLTYRQHQRTAHALSTTPPGRLGCPLLNGGGAKLLSRQPVHWIALDALGQHTAYSSSEGRFSERHTPSARPSVRASSGQESVRGAHDTTGSVADATCCTVAELLDPTTINRTEAPRRYNVLTCVPLLMGRSGSSSTG
jgi:hypothetical protein